MKKTSTKPKKETKKSIFKSISSYFKGVKKEAKMVKWPDFKAMIKYSTVTVAMLIFFGLFFYGFDALFAFIRGLF